MEKNMSTRYLPYLPGGITITKPEIVRPDYGTTSQVSEPNEELWQKEVRSYSPVSFSYRITLWEIRKRQLASYRDRIGLLCIVFLLAAAAGYYLNFTYQPFAAIFIALAGIVAVLAMKVAAADGKR